MIALKPYVFLKVNSSTDKRIDLAVYSASLTTPPTQAASGNTLVVTYTISNGANSLKTDIGRSLNLALGTFTKVMVKTQDSSGRLMGSVTLKLSADQFSENPYKIHCYLKTPTAASELYFRVDTTGGQGINTTIPPETLLDPNNHKVTFFFDENGSTAGVFDLSVDNPDASIYDIVEVQIRNSAKTITKGKGTTTQNDADSSGDI
jgi:hypothetical protein